MRHTVWARHTKYNQYLVSICGDVIRLKSLDKKGRTLPQLKLKVSIDGYGYPQVGMQYRPRKTARLVAETFLSHTKTRLKCQVLHRYDNKEDSRLENLYYGTPIDNLQDARVNNNRPFKVHEATVESCRKSIRVYGNEVDKVFNSIKEAREQVLGVSASVVSQAIKHNRKIGGYNIELQNQQKSGFKQALSRTRKR